MHILPIIVVALIPMVLGFVWYHPKVFGGAWMKSLGITEEDIKEGNMAVIFGLSLAMALVISYALSRYASPEHTEEGMSQFVHGIYHGVMPALYYAVPILISNSLFQRNNLTNILINAAYWIITLALMGGVMYAWLG